MILIEIVQIYGKIILYVDCVITLSIEITLVWHRAHDESIEKTLYCVYDRIHRVHNGELAENHVRDLNHCMHVE